jgi:hypothetical protein
MNLPDGFDPDPTKWLETSFACEAVLECYPIIMRTLVVEEILSYEELIEAIPDADILDVLSLNVYALPDQPLYVSECPNHSSRQEYFLAYLNGMQLMWRIDQKFPEAAASSPQLAMMLLYNGLQQAKEDKRKDDEWERKQNEDRAQ